MASRASVLSLHCQTGKRNIMCHTLLRGQVRPPPEIIGQP